MNDKTPLAELLQWLAGAPRTYGWSAILAYDRDKTNTVLRQEYIERFDSGNYLRPLRELILTTDDTAEYIYDYVFDAARLSFSNATISSSNALLTQKVIGGTQLSLSKPTGSYTRVEKVFSLDAMDGPLLESEVSLLASTGHVNRAGEIILDISQGRNPRLTFARSEYEREKGGRHLMARFAEEEEPRRRLVLNELGVSDEQFLKPGKFEIRTHAAPNSRIPGTPEHGSGAVLAFIAMEGESNGSLPVDDRDLLFLIPDGHSATVLLGQAFCIHRILMPSFEPALAAGPVYSLVQDGSGLVSRVRIETALAWEVWKYVHDDPVYESMRIDRLVMSFAGVEKRFDVVFQGQRVIVEMEGRDWPFMVLKLRNDSREYQGSVRVDWNLRHTYSVSVDPSSGAVGLVLEPDDSYARYEVDPNQLISHPPVMANFEPVARLARTTVAWYVEHLLVDKLIPYFAGVDVFRLNSLLFRGDNAVLFDSAHVPGDLAFFGRVSPALTEFAITPLEPVVGHGQRQEFAIDPHRIGVAWSVEALPGDSGAVGSIDQDGNYTAPDASLIEGVYKRVRVRATLGAHTSTALVTVVVRDISVNPLVQACGPRHIRAMSAGTLGTGTLTWRIADPASGATIAPSTEPDGDHLYTAGPASLTESFVVDEVVVTNDATGNQQSAYVLVVHGMVGLQVLYEADANPDRVQCKALFLNGGPTDGFELEWVLLAGSGSIDGNGLFSVDSAGKHRFAVVGCLMALPGMPFPYIGYCILPIPLIPLPAWLNVMGEAERLLSSPAGERGEK
ncbi:hypothetical protein [Pseudomonas japonica]|uniref:Uncharacterized protein n=1 Tax=Pseudomonas japonica TaxID=256466 RepID=A0A239GS17_9PSED|nr:hypothetical protein [Pseudomonas japonica]SNS71632.1 hypothetical protein SAMN05444352_113124 [Pseudomonas japonica]